MDISSDDGARLRLRPLSYQFALDASDNADEFDEWDDWLVIAGEITTAEGRSWSFTDPCLTTGEAQDLAEWLRHQADTDPPPPIGMPAPMQFTEPNIAFQRHSDSPPFLSLEVAFSHESLPPWLPGSGLGRVYPMTLHVSADALSSAAAQWAAEIAAFPRRST
ncbi:WapI family immunity protein [Micromonosporaceae bacterium Da 78-11]